MFEDVPSLRPIHFFRLSGELSHAEKLTKLFKKPFLLADTSDLTNEDIFADVSIAWNAKGLLCSVRVHQPFQESFFPNVTRGDAFELWVDTRDLKTAGSCTRFCHHFVFFPNESDPSQEITRLRAEEMRPMADPDDLFVSTEFGKKSYTMDITLSRDALFGYDPDQFQRLGLTYRVSRKGGDPQNFAVSSHEYPIERHPALWASFALYK